MAGQVLKCPRGFNVVNKESGGNLQRQISFGEAATATATGASDRKANGDC